jgi:hypothetical protein
MQRGCQTTRARARPMRDSARVLAARPRSARRDRARRHPARPLLGALGGARFGSRAASRSQRPQARNVLHPQRDSSRSRSAEATRRGPRDGWSVAQVGGSERHLPRLRAGTEPAGGERTPKAAPGEWRPIAERGAVAFRRLESRACAFEQPGCAIMPALEVGDDGSRTNGIGSKAARRARSARRLLRRWWRSSRCRPRA